EAFFEIAVAHGQLEEARGAEDGQDGQLGAARVSLAHAAEVRARETDAGAFAHVLGPEVGHGVAEAIEVDDRAFRAAGLGLDLWELELPRRLDLRAQRGGRAPAA